MTTKTQVTTAELKDAITKYPHRCHMLVYVYRSNPTKVRNQTVPVDLDDPADDTVFCIAGWVMFLAGHQPYFDNNREYRFKEAPEQTAINLLNITSEIADLLFNFSWWPDHLRQQLMAAAKAQNKAAYAATMCQAIDLFIPTDTSQLVS